MIPLPHRLVPCVLTAAMLPTVLAAASPPAASQDRLPAGWVPLLGGDVHVPSAAELLAVRDEIRALEHDWAHRRIDALGMRLHDAFLLIRDVPSDGITAGGEQEFTRSRLLEMLRSKARSDADEGLAETLRDDRTLFADRDRCTVFYRLGDASRPVGASALVLADLERDGERWVWRRMRRVLAFAPPSNAEPMDLLAVAEWAEALSRADLLLERVWRLREKAELEPFEGFLRPEFRGTLSNPRQARVEQEWNGKRFVSVLGRVLEVLLPREPRWTVEDSFLLPRGEDAVAVFQNVRYEDHEARGGVFVLAELRRGYREGWRLVRWFERTAP